jgi:hypothetical protein
MTDTDQPRATETEQEQGAERIADEEDMRGYPDADRELPAENPAAEERE